jgi:hypothetical protein
MGSKTLSPPKQIQRTVKESGHALRYHGGPAEGEVVETIDHRAHPKSHQCWNSNEYSEASSQISR